MLKDAEAVLVRCNRLADTLRENLKVTLRYQPPMIKPLAKPAPQEASKVKRVYKIPKTRQMFTAEQEKEIRDYLIKLKPRRPTIKDVKFFMELWGRTQKSVHGKIFRTLAAIDRGE